jgi:two-component system chemotaxis response regulator CheB
MPKIRILIVDDAVVVRRMMAEVLSSDPELEVVGTAANGRIALAKIPQVNPDLVILDVEMPEMDGLQTLAALRKTYPLLPVVMFSTLTQRGAAATLDALFLGASDYVAKPAHVSGVAHAVQCIRQDLIPRIKLFGAGVAGPAVSSGLSTPSPARVRSRCEAPRLTRQRVDILAIGVSTGGPKALATLLAQLPADFLVPVVIVQHMPPLFTKALAERLTSQSRIRVDEGIQGGMLERGRAWVAPGNFHMIVEKSGATVRIGTHQGPPENSCRPAVDVLFRSVAETYGSHALAVVLTGMGQDGLRGCEAIREAGGQVLVQDEASSVVWGMPGFVAKAGLAEEVLPLDQLGTAIVRRVSEGGA